MDAPSQSHPFKAVFSGHDDWAFAAKACTDGLGELPPDSNIGFVYLSDLFAEDAGSILTYLRQKTGINHWVGSVAMGVFGAGREIMDEPCVAVMVGALPDQSFQVFPSLTKPDESFAVAAAGWLKDHPYALSLIHVDPHHAQLPLMIDQVADLTGGFVIGGITSAREAAHQIADRITGGGISGVLLDPSLGISTGISQGFTPIGEAHVVSDGVDNVIVGLDGEPALEVFKQDIGDLLAHDLARVAGYIHAAFPIEGSDTGAYAVRSLMGIDPVRGWLAIAGEVPVGDRVLFVRRDPEAAREDLARMVRETLERSPGIPRGAIYISCLARGEAMFGEEGAELQLVQSNLGDIPLIGYAAGGEISGGRLHQYTGLLILFS